MSKQRIEVQYHSPSTNSAAQIKGIYRSEKNELIVIIERRIANINSYMSLLNPSIQTYTADIVLEEKLPQKNYILVDDGTLEDSRCSSSSDFQGLIPVYRRSLPKVIERFYPQTYKLDPHSFRRPQQPSFFGSAAAAGSQSGIDAMSDQDLIEANAISCGDIYRLHHTAQDMSMSMSSTEDKYLKHHVNSLRQIVADEGLDCVKSSADLLTVIAQLRAEKLALELQLIKGKKSDDLKCFVGMGESRMIEYVGYCVEIYRLQARTEHKDRRTLLADYLKFQAEKTSLQSKLDQETAELRETVEQNWVLGFY